MIKTANVFLLILFNISSDELDNVFRSISTNTGLKPFITIELISETHVKDGTIISFLFFLLFIAFKIEIKYNLLMNQS